MRALPLLILLAIGGTVQAGPPAGKDGAPAPTYHRRVDEVPAYPIAGGKGTASILLDAAAGSPEAAVTLLTLEPGARVPSHTHEGSAEILYIIEGEVDMIIAGTALHLQAGAVVRVPRATPHQALVRTRLRAVQVYAPAGPEQRFAPPGKR